MADPITFVIDISHHQDKALNLALTRRDGCELCLMKAGEGSSFADPDFSSNLAEAREAGQLVGAYWYQRGNVSAGAHVAKIKQVVPRDVPVVLDVEANSGGIALTRETIRLLNAEGYRTPLLYIPRWYWQQIGSPSLAGLPPLWSSRYPDNRVGTLASEWAGVPAHYWNGYGGLDVLLLQFTSSARIAGYQPLDASAFRGTRAQLAARLGQSGGEGPTSPNPPQTEDNDMPMVTAPAGTDEHLNLTFKNKTELRLACSWGQTVEVHSILFYGDTGKDPSGTGVGGGYDGGLRTPPGKWTFQPNRPGPLTIPAGATMATIRYTAKHSFAVGVE